jgi:hypothetical protein
VTINWRALVPYIVGGLILAAGGGFLLYNRGVHTGKRNETIHALDTARVTLAKKVVVAKIVAAKADSSAKREVKKSGNLHKRVQVARAALVVDTSLSRQTRDYIGLTDSVMAQDTVTIQSLVAANAKKDSVVIPLTAHDSLGTTEIAEVKQISSPRIGFKTGVAAGAVVVVGLVWLVSHLHR